MHRDRIGDIRVERPSCNAVLPGLGGYKFNVADRVRCPAVGRPEPLRVVVVEVAVAVARAPVTQPPARSERGRIGLIRGVVVQRCRGVVLDVDVGPAARAVRVVPDEIDARLLGELAGLVDLQLTNALHDLRADARVGRIAGFGVRAGGSHRRAQVPVRRSAARCQTLLLLKRHQDDFGGDAARHLNAVDELRDAHRSALQRRAHQVTCGLRIPCIAGGDAGSQNVQTLAVLASPDLAVEKRLDLRRRHGVAVVEERIGDDVLRVEADDSGRLHETRINRGRLGQGRCTRGGYRSTGYGAGGHRDDKRADERDDPDDRLQRRPTRLRAGRTEISASGVHVTIVTEVNSRYHFDLSESS